MADKPVLSDDEIDSLMDTAESPDSADQQQSGHEDSASRYDFSGRENKLFAQMPGLRELNEKVCGDLAVLISEKLRISFEITLADIAIKDAQSMEEGFADDSLVSMARLEPLQGFSLVEVPAGLLSQITENYFGGANSDDETTASRAFSRSEIRLQSRLMALFFAAVESGWSSALKFRHELISTEADLQIIKQSKTPGKSVCISFEFAHADRAWQINWLFSYSSLEPLREKLGGGVQDSGDLARTDWSAAMQARLLDVPISASAVLLELELGLGEVMGLKRGSIIPIRMPESAQFRVEDLSMMHAEYGANESQKAVKLIGRIAE